MEGSNLAWVLLIALIPAAIFYVTVLLLFGAKHDAREPPEVPNPLPLIGHLLGLLWWGQQYFERVR